MADTVGHGPWLPGDDAEALVGRQAVFTFTTHRGPERAMVPRAQCMEGTQRSRTSARDHVVWGNLVQGPSAVRSSSRVLSVPWLPSDTGPRSISLIKSSLYFFAAFSTPGSELQAVDDDPRLAAGNPDLHEDITVSFQPVWADPARGRVW